METHSESRIIDVEYLRPLGPKQNMWGLDDLTPYEN